MAENMLREKGRKQMNKTAESTLKVSLQILTITANIMKIQHQQFPSTMNHKLCIHKL